MTEPPVHALIVEDDTDDFLILKVMVSGLKKRPIDLDRVSTYEEAMQKMREGRHDVCLLDYRLKGKNGIDFLREASRKGYTTPIIFLTGQGDYDVDVEAMQLGASDFLYKNKIDKDMLERAIRYAIGRKKTEDILRQREDFFREVIENSLEGVAIVDSKGLRYLSPSIERILGYLPAEVIQTNGSGLIHPEDMPRIQEMFKEIFATPDLVLSNEFRAKHQNGHWRTLEVVAKNSRSAKSIQGVVLNYRDVTVRKDAERISARLAAIVESSNDAVYSITFEGIIASWNPGAQRIYGFTPEEIGGRDFSLLIPINRQAEFPRLLEAARDGKAVANFNTIHLTKNKQEVVLSLTVSPIKNAMGQIALASVIARDITESEKAKTVHSALESERDALLQRLQLQMEQMPIACVMNDRDFNTTYWNPAAERIFGFSFSDVEGKKPKETFLPPFEWEKADKIFKRLMSGEQKIHETVNQNIRKDGQRITCEWYYNSFFDEDGNYFGGISMCIDITERKKADESRARLASILEQTPDAVIGADLNGNIVDWNSGAGKMYGYSAEEVVGKHGSLLEAENRRNEIEKMRKVILEGREVLNYETVRRKKNGKLIDVAVTLSPQKNELGEIVGFSSIARDITERKKGDEVQAQLAAILQQTPDAVIGSDLDGNVFSWNRGAEAMFGYSLEEIAGKPVTVLAPEDRKHESNEMGEIALGGESISNFETVRLKKDKTLIDVSITLSQVKDSRGKIIGLSAIARDITERRKAEESLWKHEEQLRRVEKMNAIGRLAGGVAHDFNNLLSVIGGNAEFLLSSLEKANPHREELEEIQKAVRRGADLTKQLLVFGQKQVVQPQPVNLNELSAEMRKMLKRLIDATVDLAIIQDKNIQPILSDLGQMQQVILNLVLNARDAMPHGGNLIIETKMVEGEKLDQEQRPTLPPGDYVRLNVTDTGTGMSPEIQKHIFEPFFTTKAGKGTGLGLASVYGIVTKWSGHIFLYSTPGMGTTFSLYFPALPPGEAAAPKLKQMALLSQGTETLLVAEDEEPVRKVLVRTLERYGYRVLEAQNGIEAVQKAWGYRDPIHLLLTDAMMPKMNGRELANELRKTRPKMKILFVSGYPREVLSQQGILDSGIHLVQKPFELEDLTREIRKILDEK